MSIVQELLEQMGKIDPQAVDFGNDGPKEGQTVVGTLSDDARRLWGVLIKTREKAKLLAEEIQTEKADSDHYNKLEAQMEELNLRAETIKDLFWTTIRLELSELAGKHHIGVCQNGQVYWQPCDCRHRTVGFEIITFGPEGFSSSFRG